MAVHLCRAGPEWPPASRPSSPMIWQGLPAFPRPVGQGTETQKPSLLEGPGTQKRISPGSHKADLTTWILPEIQGPAPLLQRSGMLLQKVFFPAQASSPNFRKHRYRKRRPWLQGGRPAHTSTCTLHLTLYPQRRVHANTNRIAKYPIPVVWRQSSQGRLPCITGQDEAHTVAIHFIAMAIRRRGS